MKFKKIILMMLLLLAVLTITSVSAADNLTDEGTLQDVPSDEIELREDVNDEIVSSSQKDIIGEPDNGTFTALQRKINDAGADSTIELENDYSYDEGFNTDGITIDKPLTIDGKGYTIDAKGKSRVFYITSAVTLKNLTIKNAYFKGESGAIYFSQSGSLINCNFIGNKVEDSDGRGGAVCFWNEGTVTNCNFINNTVSGFGGAVHFYDNGEVTNCNFTNNRADLGGAVYLFGNGEVTNCNFIDNIAIYGEGGAINMGSGTVTNCNFANNFAKGGAVHFYDNGEVTNCNFVDNTAYEDSGEIYFGSSGTVTNCNFTNNKATIGNAIYSDGDNSTAINCNFLDLLESEAGYQVTFINCIFKDTKAPDDGNNPQKHDTNPSQNTNAQTTTTNNGNTIKLTLKTVKVKKSAKKLVLKATLKINGKKVKGKTVKFKFNGKTYKAKTNKKGVAKVTIKKSVLKKLKVGKKVKYQASYGGKTVKKTVKIQK